MVIKTSKYHGFDMVKDSDIEAIRGRFVLEQTPEGELDYRYYDSQCIPKDSFKISIPGLLADNASSNTNNQVDDKYVFQLITKLLKSKNFLVSESAVDCIDFYVEAYNGNI